MRSGVLAWLLLAACGGDAPRVPEGSGTARTLGTFSPKLPDDPRAQTLEALGRDAWRREWRFVDAADPGFLFRSTRVPLSEIAAGLWSPAELFEIGAQLFHLDFTREVGFGAADLPALGRVHSGARGGPDARRCATCHWRGGPAGAGDGADVAYLDGDGDSQSSAIARNPISLSGAGIVELLAAEMTAELAVQRTRLERQARDEGAVVRAEIFAKAVSFGFLEARPDGTLDTSGLVGIDEDLVVRPFGWKGTFATIRDAAEDALLVHHGLQSDHLVATAPASRMGTGGSPDPDGDGVTAEIEEGQLTALTLYVAMQEVPQISPPGDVDGVLLFARGRTDFDALGCADCHTPSMRLDRAAFVLPARDGGRPLTVDLAAEGAEPRIARSLETGSFEVALWSDLRRHDMGPDLADPRADRGVEASQFVTRPLWGLARSRPYLHDARAPTIEDAILAHGGEAAQSRDRFAALSDAERAPLRTFLTALARASRIVVP